MKVGKKTKIGLYVLGVLLALFVLVHTPPAKRVARWGLVRVVSGVFDGAVTVERLDYRLWRGDFEVRGMSVESDTEPVPFLVSADRIHARISPTLMFTGEIERLDITVVGLVDFIESIPPELRAKDPIKKFSEIGIRLLGYTRVLRITDSTFRMSKTSESGDVVEWLTVGNIDAHAIEADDEHRIVLHASGGQVRIGSVDQILIELDAIDADLVASLGLLRVASASVLKGDSFVRAEGNLDISDRTNGTLETRYALDGSLLRLIDDDLVITGVATGEAQVHIELKEADIDAVVRSESIEWEEVAVRDVEAAARLSKGVLRIERASAGGFGGEARGSGELELREAGEQHIELSWSGIDVVDAVRQIAGKTLPVAARVSGDARLQLTGWRLEDAVGDARVRLDPGADLAGNLRAELQQGKVQLETDRLELVPWSTTLAARAALDLAVREPETSHELEVDYELRAANIAQLAELVPDLPVSIAGAISATGRVDGTLEEPHWTAQIATEALTLEKKPLTLTATLEGSTKTATLHEVRLDTGHGSLVATGVAPLGPTQTWAVTASLDGFELETAELPLDATIDGTIEFTGPALDPDLSAELQVHPFSAFGVEGAASLVAGKRGREIQIRELEVEYAGGTLDGSGSYALDSGSVDGSLRMMGVRLSELPFLPEHASGVEGIAALQVTLTGTLEGPEGHARIDIRDLSNHGNLLPGVAFDLEAADGRVLIEVARQDGARLLVGQLLLEGDYPLHAELDLGALPATELIHSIPILVERERAEWEVKGVAEVDLKLAAPETVTYGARVESIEAQFPDRSARTAPFEISGNVDRLSIAGFEMVAERLHLFGGGTIPFSRDELLDVAAHGDLDLAVLGRLNPELTMEGQADFDLTLSGSISDPRAEGELRVQDGRGSYRNLEWSALNIDLFADNDRLRNLSLEAEVLGGTVALGGELSLRSDAPGGFIELNVRDMDLTSLLPPERRSPDLSAVTSVSGRIDVTGFELAGLSGAGDIDSVSIRAREVAVETVHDAPWRLEGGELSIPALRLEGAGGELELRLDSLSFTESLNIQAVVNGRLVAEILNPLIAAYGMQVRGLATLDVGIEVENGELALSGGGSVRDGRFTSFEPQLSLSETNLDFVLTEKMLEITRLEARSGSGELQGGGYVDWSNRDRPVVDLRVNAAAVPLEIMGGFRGEVSGEVRLDNTSGEPTLFGDLELDRGQITRELDDNDNDLSAQSAVLRDPTLEQGLLSRLNLNLVVRTARNVQIDNSTARLEFGGNIAVTGTVATPEAGGMITLKEGGSFNIANRRFLIISGRIDLTGFPLEKPYIDVQAAARVGTTTINIDLEGNADDLRTQLTAPDNPELTEGDLASLLVTGRTLEDAGEGGLQIAATWMMSSLAGLVHEGLGDMITFGPPPGAGPLILSEEADPTARLSFGYPVTDRLSVTYSIALDSTERRLWILDYRLARNFWIRAIQENAIDYAVGISQRLTFNLRRRATSASSTGRRNQHLASVSIGGLPPDLARSPEVRQGDRYDYWKVQDEAVSIHEDLVKAGYLSAVVDVETHIEEGETQDAVSVSFSVLSGAKSEIVWRGDDPGSSIRNDVEGSWDGRAPEEFLLLDLARVVRTRLQAERYFIAEVATREEREASDPGAVRNIVFDVMKGMRGKTVALAFEGNDILSNDELRAVLPATDTPEFFQLLERPSDLERGLRLRYATEGYLDATASAPEERFDPATKTFHVEITIAEGPLVRIAAVDFGDSLSIDPSRLMESFGVAPGASVDFPEIRMGQTRLRTLYRSEGFSEVKVRAALERTAAGVNVALLITEGTRARVGEIRVVGNSRTNGSVILNEVTFRTGDPIRITDFQLTQKRLYDLGIFRSADVRSDPAQLGREVQDILVQVAERSDVDINYGLRYNFIRSDQTLDLESEPRSSGLEATARVNFINPFARGTTLGFSLFYQEKHQLFRATLRMPTFFRRHITTEFIVETEDETFDWGEGYPSFESRGNSVTFQQTKKLTDIRTDKLSLQWNFRYGHFRADRFDSEGERWPIDTYRPRFGVSIIEDRRDSFVNPTHGRFWNVTLQAVPQIWGSDVTYVRMYGQIFLYFPLPKSIVWASGFRAGISTGSRELLLLEDRFQSGGANSVRGYMQNTLGPAVFFPTPEGEPNRLYLGGQAVTVINQELRFPIWNIIHGGVFWDAGNVWATTKQFSFFDLKHTIGAGLRVVLPFGALRFDYAEPLNPCTVEELERVPITPCAAETVRFHFSFGYAF